MKKDSARNNRSPLMNHAEIVRDASQAAHQKPDQSWIARNLRGLSLTISAATLAALAAMQPSEVEAKPHHHASAKSELKKPKSEYQVFPNGAKLEKVTGKKLAALEGSSDRCDSLNWLRKKDRHTIRQQCEYYNPWNNGVPLVKIHPKDLSVHLSPHFTVGELARIDPKDRRFVRAGEMIARGGEFYGKFVRIDPEILTMLEKTRGQLGHEVQIDEGYRGYGYNGMTYYEGQGCKYAQAGKEERKTIRKIMKGKGKKALARAMNDANTRAKQACIKEKSVHTSGGAIDMVKVKGLHAAAKHVVEQRGSGGVGRYSSPIIHIDARDNTIAMWPPRK